MLSERGSSNRRCMGMILPPPKDEKHKVSSGEKVRYSCATETCKLLSQMISYRKPHLRMLSLGCLCVLLLDFIIQYMYELGPAVLAAALFSQSHRTTHHLLSPTPPVAHLPLVPSIGGSSTVWISPDK